MNMNMNINYSNGYYMRTEYISTDFVLLNKRKPQSQRQIVRNWSLTPSLPQPVKFPG